MSLPTSADAGIAREALNEAYSELRRHYHTEPYGQVVKWLDALIVAQQAHMTSCNPARLEAAQIRVKHLVGLRNALAAPGGASTGHAFD